MRSLSQLDRRADLRSAHEQRAFESLHVKSHYENDSRIFSKVLDSQLTYSTGIFQCESDDLEVAQCRKFDRIAELLDIQPGERVFDAGCGWGSVMLNLARRSEGKFRGVTLSTRQHKELTRRANKMGLGNRIQVEVNHVEDVELTPHSVDVIYFVGSIVHMHARQRIHHWAAQALRPGGRLLISDCYYPAKVRGDRNSNATRHILSETLGYCRLVTLSDELALIEHEGLDIILVQDLTSSYVRTVDNWINNIRANRVYINTLAPGFATQLQSYMSVGRLSFQRRTALEYMILASK